jgi:S-adenosylmethionine synthetase
VKPPIAIESLPGMPVTKRRIELVERKGLGHPDTICDSLVEVVALGLNRMYLEHLGVIAHYNVDKALLIAGQSLVRFGRGEVKRPARFIVGDRATFGIGGHRLPVEETAYNAIDAWLACNLPRLRPHLTTSLMLAPGSEQLRSIFRRDEREMPSNDTSGASGYAPATPTEQIVLGVEQFVNGEDFKASFPDTGHDVKVFGLREDDRLSLTVAMPLLAEAVASESMYFQRKEEIVDALTGRFRDAPFKLRWQLNNLDTAGRGEEGVYLTVTGTSVENADSGQVGRGNRANGLIAFSRPGGNEAAPGKNASAHAGKIYSVLSHRLAEQIQRGAPGLVEVCVHVATRIGEPVDRPWVGVQVMLEDGIALADVEPAIREKVEAELDQLPDFRARLGRGEFAVC